MRLVYNQLYRTFSVHRSKSDEVIHTFNYSLLLFPVFFFTFTCLAIPSFPPSIPYSFISLLIIHLLLSTIINFYSPTDLFADVLFLSYSFVPFDWLNSMFHVLSGLLSLRRLLFILDQLTFYLTPTSSLCSLPPSLSPLSRSYGVLLVVDRLPQ